MDLLRGNSGAFYYSMEKTQKKKKKKKKKKTIYTMLNLEKLSSFVFFSGGGARGKCFGTFA
jgi:hypothetical protein